MVSSGRWMEISHPPAWKNHVSYLKLKTIWWKYIYIKVFCMYTNSVFWQSPSIQTYFWRCSHNPSSWPSTPSPLTGKCNLLLELRDFVANNQNLNLSPLIALQLVTATLFFPTEVSSDDSTLEISLVSLRKTFSEWWVRLDRFCPAWSLVANDGRVVTLL